MVGYVQSRGRARNKTSTFVIMIQKDDTTHLSRYTSLKEGEPEVNRVYQSRQQSHDSQEEVDEDEDEINPTDLLQRERYVVPSTNAILNYDNSINLLQYLCDLIPRDAFTPPHIPKFFGDFQSTVHLPPSIPLSEGNRTFTGPLRRTKKEARRAASFLAVKHLHQLNVFDDYLLPAANSKGKATEDGDGRIVSDTSRVPTMMVVSANDPWTIGPRLWIHTIYIGSRPVAGLVTGTALPPTKVLCNACWVRLKPGKLMTFSDDKDEGKKLEYMREFTKLGIWYRITSRPLTLAPSLFVVPITADHRADFETMKRLIENPAGIDDWSSIGESDYDKLMIMNKNEYGRPRLLRRIRFDLTPLSKPTLGSRGDDFPTYYDYFMVRWARKKGLAQVPRHGPMLDTMLITRSSDGTYPIKPPENRILLSTVPNGMLIPRDCCRWIPMSRDLCQAYDILSALCHRVTDIYRVQRARCELGLPLIIDDLLVEAFTLPSASAGYNNQRMETLGDAVLELCTTVHLFNKYPYRHEGQLTILRQQSVSNRYLLARAKEIGLEKYLISEGQSVNRWRYVEPVERSLEPAACRTTSRCFPRRSLQDCMEATLGASFITGGIQMSLHTGEALGLAFGGTMPWPMRYSRKPEASPAPTLFKGLEDTLGYTFHRSELLLEAVTHPSFVLSSGGSSYQRLEFLGDGKVLISSVDSYSDHPSEALLDLVVIKYLYDKFPGVTSHQLALPRAKAVCAPALASLAIRRLGLHKIILINSVDLTEEIERYVPLLLATSGEDIIKRGWRYDPPKALSDVFESVMGAILVDSGYNYERAAAIVEFIMQEILVALSPAVSRDPVSELVEWGAGSGCTSIRFR
jgi:endoribonuclease Dicer